MPPGNMLRTVMMDSAGAFTLTDLALSQTLEEYMMGAWNHFAFSMSPTGFTYTMDGEVLPDTVYGIFMHTGYLEVDGEVNNAQPTPSHANTPWSAFEGFGDSPLVLGARAVPSSVAVPERREWFGYLSNFAIYSDALDGTCTTAIYSGELGIMPAGLPPARLLGADSPEGNNEWADVDTETVGDDTGTSGLSVWQPDPSLAAAVLDGSTTLLESDVHMTWNAYSVAPRGASSRMVQDGLFDDWECIPFMAQTPFMAPATHPGEVLMFEEYNGGTWSGVIDHSAAIGFAWDTDNLYLGIKVKDDTHQLNGNSGWNGDSVQVVFANEAQDAITHLYNFAESDTGDHIAHHERGPAGTTSVVIERNEDRLTTAYEITFTAPSLDRASFQVDETIAVGICINDGDQGAGQGGQKGWSGWGPHSAVYGKTPSETGLVTLGSTVPARNNPDGSPGCVPAELWCYGEGGVNVPVVGDADIYQGGAGNSAESGGASVHISDDTGTSGLSIWRPDADFARTTMPGGENALMPSDVDMTFDAYHVSIQQDGLFMDWDCVPFMAQPPFYVGDQGNEDVRIFEEYNGGHWDGATDHSTALSFAWDYQNFYLGIKVVDDTHQLNGNSGWNGDSVQVVFANEAQDAITHLYNYAESSTGDHIAHHERGPGGTSVVIERDEEAQPSPTTGYEITFTASSLGRDSFTAGQVIAVGVCVNDGDQGAGQGGQKGWSGWGPHSAVYGKTPSQTGLVTLTATVPARDNPDGSPGCDVNELDVTGSSRRFHNTEHGTAGR